MHDLNKRRIRIVGNAGELRGYMLTVRDADTNECIPHVKAITVYLTASGTNWAAVTYYGTNAEGAILLEDDAPVEHIAMTYNPLIDVTAYEL